MKHIAGIGEQCLITIRIVLTLPVFLSGLKDFICIIKSPRAASRVKWLNGGKNKVRGPTPSSSSGYLSGWHSQPINQKANKGGVLRKRQTLSLARFDHSCLRNALLEMVKGALKLMGVCLR
jgi:hypothetical protein